MEDLALMKVAPRTKNLDGTPIPPWPTPKSDFGPFKQDELPSLVTTWQFLNVFRYI
jgi:hypothetical protein